MTLPGHDRRPLLQLGEEDLAQAAARAAAHEGDVVGDLGEGDRDHLERAGHLDQRVAGALRLERVGRGRDGQAGVLGQQRTHALGELAVRVEAGAGGRAAEGQLPQPDGGVGDPVAPLADLGGVARELLAQRDRHGVHQVRAAGLHQVGELHGLRGQRVAQVVERGKEALGDLLERGGVHGRREHVVRALAHVDVVVRVRAVAGEVGDHLVGVHVRRGARAGLEDVDRELVVVLAGRHRVGGGGDAPGQLRVEEPQVGVDPRRGALDPAQPPHDRQRHALSGYREVLHRLAGLPAPKLRHLAPFDRLGTRRRSPTPKRTAAGRAQTADDHHAGDAGDRIEVRVLGDDRQTVGQGRRRDPEVVDVQAAARASRSAGAGAPRTRRPPRRSG